MAYQIRWSPKAVQSLEVICIFIAKDSPHYAALFAGRILQIVRNLGSFPMAGRMVPEYKDSQLREKIYENYRIVYRVKGDWIEIVMITHGARLLKKSL
jgi:toxin ParE1/3/4